MTGSRLLAAVLFAGLGCLLAVGAAWRPGSEVAAPAADRTGPLAVLAAWDRSRAEAWRLGDPTALARLYTRGSASGEADRGLLAAYAERGLRVVGLRMQRAAVEVVTAGDDRLVLRVTDRVVGAAAIGPRGQVALPRDAWSTRSVVLERVGEEWRVTEVRDQASAVASTDVTSRSPNS